MIKLGYITIRYEPFWWWQSDTRGVEVLSALAALIWMAILMLPGSTIETHQSLAAMGLFGGDWLWALIFGLVWTTQSLAMCGNVELFRYPAALFSLILWSFMATIIFFADPIAAGWGVYALFAAAMFWVLIRGPTKHVIR